MVMHSGFIFQYSRMGKPTFNISWYPVSIPGKFQLRSTALSIFYSLSRILTIFNVQTTILLCRMNGHPSNTHPRTFMNMYFIYPIALLFSKQMAIKFFFPNAFHRCGNMRICYNGYNVSV